MEDLKILQKVYDMILYGNQCLSQFPRSERYALAADPNMKYLPLRKYENWSKMLNEIGKMLGGWMKAFK